MNGKLQAVESMMDLTRPRQPPKQKMRQTPDSKGQSKTSISSKTQTLSNPSSKISRASTKLKIKKTSGSKLSDMSILSHLSLTMSSRSVSSNSTMSRSSHSKHSKHSSDSKSIHSKDSIHRAAPLWRVKKKPVVEPVPVPVVKVSKTYSDILLYSDEDDKRSDTSIAEQTERIVYVQPMDRRNAILEMLKEIPDINDLSDASSSVELKASEEEEGEEEGEVEKEDDSDLKGHFVAPVQSTSVEEVEEDVIGDQQGDQGTGNSSLPSLDSFSDHDSVWEQPSVALMGEQDLASAFTCIKICDSKVKFFDVSEEMPQRTATTVCQLFLQQLIEQVVQKCERNSQEDEERKGLHRRLDKEKVIETLIALSHQFDEELWFNENLELGLIDHFHRRKAFDMTNPNQFEAINRQRYKSSLVELDRLLELEDATVRKSQTLRHELRHKVESLRVDGAKKNLHLKKIIAQTLITNENYVHLQELVKNFLNGMDRFRNELCDMQLELLHTQHRYAEIRNKSEELENLGGGLYMRDFLTNHTLVLMLGGKIAERSAELNRLKLKVRYDVHALAHLKCKEHMNLRTYSCLAARLKECEASRRHFHDLIYRGKLRHMRLCRELNKIKTSGTLLCYPHLLRDYDRTTNYVNEKRNSVEKLRDQQKSLILRISVIETYAMAAMSRNRSKRSLMTLKKELTKGNF